MRDDQRLIVDTRKFFKENSGNKSFLYCNWGQNENEGMTQSYDAIKALLTSEAPKGLRWMIERARGADHQQTQPIALPSALYEYFTAQPNTNQFQKNRLAQHKSRQ